MEHENLPPQGQPSAEPAEPAQPTPPAAQWPRMVEPESDDAWAALGFSLPQDTPHGVPAPQAGQDHARIRLDPDRR